jgi:hypothetical protein
MDFECWDWKAVQDNTPGPDDHGTLTITGTCGKFPTDGYQLKLVGRRGGFNPWEPFFNLVVDAPTSGVPEVLSDESVTHTMSVDRQAKYTKVTIYFDDRERWSMDVDQVS